MNYGLKAEHTRPVQHLGRLTLKLMGCGEVYVVMTGPTKRVTDSVLVPDTLPEEWEPYWVTKL